MAAKKKSYVLDTNVLIHDPSSLLEFEEHQVVIPITVLEELDKLKVGKSSIAADCRQVIRQLDQMIGEAPPKELEQGVPIKRGKLPANGSLSVLLEKPLEQNPFLPNDLNDNKIINSLIALQQQKPDRHLILVSKDINMRLKARSCGIAAEDYHSDQLVSDIQLLSKGYIEISGSIWDRVNNVDTQQMGGETYHIIPRNVIDKEIFVNQFILDKGEFVGWIVEHDEKHIKLLDMNWQHLLQQEAWGLRPRDIHQALSLHLLLSPKIHLVNLSGSAGSGKTILALAAAIEMTVANKIYRRIIATRSTRGLDEDIGFLPGTEAEKMEPWLGAFTDNLEALHSDDNNTHSSIEYIKDKVPLQFKSLNYIRGRSFQHSLIIIDECQNLTPHQIKTIVTRAGTGSKVVCLGNLAQIDTPNLNATSSGLTYLSECFKGFIHGGSIQLQGVPRSVLAEYAETHL